MKRFIEEYDSEELSKYLTTLNLLINDSTVEERLFSIEERIKSFKDKRLNIAKKVNTDNLSDFERELNFNYIRLITNKELEISGEKLKIARAYYAHFLNSKE